MTALGVPVPGGFTVTTDACRAYLRTKQVPAGLDAEVAAARRGARGEGRQALRRPRRPAARVRPLGRGDLDARDDGHDPQPRPERRGRRGPREEHRQRAHGLRLVPPADPDVRRGRRRDRRRAVRGRADRPQARARRRAGHRPDRRRLPGAGRHLQGHLRRGARAAASRRTPASSWPAPSAPSSTRGTRRARRSTGAPTTSRTTSGRR